MNKETNRNLAFLLAKTFSDESFDDISGGAGQVSTAFNPSFNLTGTSIRNHDYAADGRIIF